MTNEEKKGGAGCLKAAGIGCLVVAVVGGLAVFWAVRNADRLLRVGTAKVLMSGADAMFDTMQMDKTEKDAALEAVRELTEKIKNGEITAEQGKGILTALAEGPLPMVVAVRFLEATILQQSGLDPDEKEQARITLSRFSEGLIQGTIPREKGDEALDMISVQDEHQRDIKTDVTDADIARCLAVMKDAADQAGIEERLFKTDFAREIRKYIDQGLGR